MTELTLKRCILDVVGKYDSSQRGPDVASVHAAVKQREIQTHGVAYHPDQYAVFLQMRAMMRDGLLTRERPSPKAAYRWHITVKGRSERCPDKGACHHWCGQRCFRVQCCSPLSGVFPDDVWPKAIEDEHRQPLRVLSEHGELL
jgi:hypothetical protein